MGERPVECGQCKKPAKVIYKEIVGETITVTEMCVDCPILLERLHGSVPSENYATQEETGTGLYCGHCHTPLESVKMGGPMGCSECYTLFGDLLVSELVAEDKIPSHLFEAKRNQPLHIGKNPEGPVNMPASNRLTSLNEALNEALQKENYEEAATLRDQIKELMEKKDESGA
ncbi:MAG: Protein-arginine kinase activator protein [Chlamydiae bacterium]|nr:Protein-arginine kinase activator protein [Chlamydiota bacterium]